MRRAVVIAAVAIPAALLATVVAGTGTGAGDGRRAGPPPGGVSQTPVAVETSDSR